MGEYQRICTYRVVCRMMKPLKKEKQIHIRFSICIDLVSFEKILARYL